MGDKEDYLTDYRVFFENFAATVNPEDQLPVNIAGYTITEAELTGEVLYWTTQYLTEKQCPASLMTPLRRIILDEVRTAAKLYPNEFGFNSDESVYIALRLMQAVTARVNDVCLRYLDNSKLDTLPPPSIHKELKTVSSATKNSRRVMEDRHIEIGNLEALFGIETTEPTCFYAVYDGHAGSAAATYCAAHLHQYLVESPHFHSDLKKALRDSFLRTDAEVVRKSNQERTCGGSTAVAVTVRGNRLLAAWAGDSLALLAKRMRLMQLVRPHKPSRQDERDRIESSGGTVMYWGTWRVNGQLAVSRAIGDAQYKPYVTARPEIAEVDLDGDEDFVVVACDGLWDFVTEDDVALTVYRQLAANPDDLNAVTKRLTVQAKRQGSLDNISIIVVFLKEPRDIVADNRPPMDLGLDNALANGPPFAGEPEACKRLDVHTEEANGQLMDADNGADNSDSDEDLGPETAVDVDDTDADKIHSSPTPPAHTEESSHIPDGLVDNVAESGDESEDEWNYFKGEGENNPAEHDEVPRSETPCQDNSAWETSSVDMNSSPLNPDAPVFIPGTVGSDVLLAESPRKPMPMDDLDLPDVSQFKTEAVVRPNELLDLDNCDQLNGHHTISPDDEKENINGNEKGAMDSLSFVMGAGGDADKMDVLHDLERIQKDTTDFCDIQVFQAHTESNPFASETNEELLERLKNKERDPMSMSFYQEKDDDTCDRLASNEPDVDLNAVQPLPDSDDEDVQNGFCDDKENLNPEEQLLSIQDQEPNNDIIRTEVASNIPDFCQPDNCAVYTESFTDDFDINAPQDPIVVPTDTPESHKLLFEQIPEIPDGKSSELGFSNEDQDVIETENDMLDTEKDALENEKNRAFTPQSEQEESHVEVYKLEDTHAEVHNEFIPEPRESKYEEPVHSPEPVEQFTNNADLLGGMQNEEIKEKETIQDIDIDERINEFTHTEAPEIRMEPELQTAQTEFVVESPVPLESPLPAQSPVPAQSPLPSEYIPEISRSPAPIEFTRKSPEPEFMSKSPEPEFMSKSPEPEFISKSPAPDFLSKSPAPDFMSKSPEPDFMSKSPAPDFMSKSPAPDFMSEVALSPEDLPVSQSPLPSQSPAPSQSPLPTEPIASTIEADIPRESPAPDSPIPTETVESRLSPAPEPEIKPQIFTQSASPAPESRLIAETEPAQELLTGHTPDIVPDRYSSELVTDIDIGIPESRAQEICLPVTSEIRQEDAVETATPPPTPAVEATAPPLDETPIAADIVSDKNKAIASGVAAAAVATAAAVTAVAKSKTPLKKSPTTPTPKTPLSAAKKTATPRPLSATKPAPATKPAAPKPAAAKPAIASKAGPPASKPAAKPAPKPAAARPAPKPTLSAVPKPAPTATKTAPKLATARPATATARPATATARPATATGRPAAPRPAAPRPATAPAKPKEPVKLANKKPLANGDIKPAPTKKPALTRTVPATKPAPAKPASAPNKPATTAAKTTAPRPIPRSATTTTTKSATSTVPKPAPRAATTRPALDKQSKDLANKRLTAKAAPPRTAKVPAGTTTKTAVPKMGAKKTEITKSEPPVQNGMTNGDHTDDTICKPTSPPVQDNALLPDVIA